MFDFPWQHHAPAEPDGEMWDVVVVGTGMGGGFAGLALARAGLRVLFLERGGVPGAGSAKGSRLGRLLNPARQKDQLRRLGRWPEPAVLRLDGVRRAIMPALGNGPGGSSALYGAAVERYLREDFSGENGAGGRFGELPNAWPIAYEEMLHWYREAETLLRPHGTRDPNDADDDARLAQPPRLSDRDQWLFDRFAAAGLDPYRVHCAVDDRPGCTMCAGAICPRRCKGDGASRGLIPALEDHGAKVLFNFAAERLECAGGRVVAVHGRHAGRGVAIRARTVVLAAGALATPLLLLNSAGEGHARGLGNNAGLVGRGVMFHVEQIFAAWAQNGLGGDGPIKTFSSRTFHQVSGERHGAIQSFVNRVEPGNIADYLRQLAPQTNLAPLQLAIRLACNVGARMLAWLFGDAALYSARTEDFAYACNRIVPDPSSPSGYAIDYTFPPELHARAGALRKSTKRALSAAGVRTFFLSGVRNLNFSHVLGSCRMGETAATGVVDPSQKVWEVDNLYIADASVLPTSAVANPSLTIAACALRMADRIVGEANLAERAARR
jgi:choline dehydrogenase-like flavoprotein